MLAWSTGSALAADPARDFDIPEQRAQFALTEFAQQANLVVLFPYEEVSRIATNPLVGTYTVEDGVQILLRDTGLTGAIADGRQLVVRVVATSSRAARPAGQRRRRKLPGSGFGGFDDGAQRSAAAPALEEITVTGSRIRASGMSTPVPVTVLTAEQAEFSAPGNLIDAFDRMPQFLGNSRPGTDVFIGTNAGQSILNMRGIGGNRTLVLVNGRRIVPSTRQGTVDINVLPESMMERVEVVTGGASAAYGTDAVAGTTNFILDTEFTGLRGHAQSGQSTRGDNANGEASLGFGLQVGLRAHFVAAIDHSESEAVETYAGRDWFQDWGTVTNPLWPASGPQLLTRPHVTSTLYTFGGLINQPGSSLDRLVFLPGGSTTPFVLGDPAALGGTRSQSGGVGDNIERDRAGDAGLVPSVQRDNVFAHASFDLSDSLRVFGQAIRGTNRVDGNGFVSVMHGPWQATVFRDNAFLPENVRQTMLAEGLPSFGFSRMGSTADLTVSRLLQGNELESYTVGVEGWTGEWRLNAYYQSGRNVDSLRAVNFPRTDRLFLAMDAIADPVMGDVVCRRTLFEPSFGCVPIDLLGAGRASSEAIAYVTEGTKTATTVNRQRVLELSADGDVGDGWGAGPVSLAVGATYREETLAQTVLDPTNPGNDPQHVAVPVNDSSSGIQGIPLGFAGVNSGVQFSIIPNFSGGVAVKELFSEILVPLAADRTFARRLNATAAVRWADYTGSGSIWSWKAGVDWQAVDALRLRGTVSRDVRAASMSERFDSAGAGATVTDPELDNQSVTFTQIIGGNTQVAPEEADTVTAGFVVQPPGARGLSISVDWYAIDIAGSIGQLGPQRIVSDCFLGAQQLCAQITRDPATRVITGLRNVFLNINAAAVSGADLEVVYNRTLGGDRSLSLRTLGSFLRENSITNLGAPKQQRAGETGALSLPSTQLVTSATYVQGPFTAFLQGRFISGGLRRFDGNRPDLGGVTIDDNTVGSAFYTDVRLSYRFPLRDGNLEVFGTVGNVFDTDPPIAANHSPFGGSTQTNATLFDTLGRRFVLGARFDF